MQIPTEEWVSWSGSWSAATNPLPYHHITICQYASPAPAHSCYTSLSVGADIISSVIHLNEDSHGKVKTIKAFATMRCIPMTWIIQDKDRRVKWLNRAKWSQHNTRRKRSSWSPARRCSGRRRCGRGRGWSCSCQQRAAALPGVPTVDTVTTVTSSPHYF